MKVSAYILDLVQNPDFQTLLMLMISTTNNQIFNCGISKHRSGQVQPFIFFDPRALTRL